MQEKESTLLDRQTLEHRYEELQERASKDALSGLLNRETAEAYIIQRLQQMTAGDACALFIIDLDHFKQVNDSLGHQAGDRAIQQAARTLSGMFRANDIIGRLGGDEFFVFLSGSVTESAVRKKGRQICRRMQAAMGGASDIVLSASVGAHFAVGAGHSFDRLYRSADDALYQVKNTGRGGFCLHLDDGVQGQAVESVRSVNAIPMSSLLEYMDSGVALLEIDDEINIIYISPSFCRMVGVTPQQFTLPKRLERFAHPDDLPALEKTLRAAAAGGGMVENVHRISWGNRQKWSWWHIRAAKIDYDSPHPVLLVTTTDITEYKENESRLQEINDRLRLAFAQTTRSLWEVDIAARTICAFDSSGKFIAGETARASFPQALIDNGWIHPDSVPRFAEFADGLLGGKVQDYGNFIVRYHETGCYRWAAFSYRTLFDDNGQAVRAVGIMEDLPKNFVGETARSILKRPIPRALMPDLILGLRADLTQDDIKELWLEGRSLGGRAGGDGCAQMLRQERARMFSPDDRQAFRLLFDREALLQAFEGGRRWLHAEYRRVDGGGAIRWVSYTVNMLEDPLTHDVYLFVYMCQADSRHRWEDALEERAGYDPITGLYDRATSLALIETALRGRKPGVCAMTLIRARGLSKLQGADTVRMERTRRYIASAMAVALGAGCIFGEYGGEELIVFYPEVRSRADLQRQLEDAFSFVRLALADTVRLAPVRFIAGVVCERGSLVSSSKMLAQSAHLCTLWQNAAADTVAFPDEKDDWNWTELQKSEQDDMVGVHGAEMQRPLSDREKDVVYECMSAMLDADSFDTSIRSVLGYIGGYYCADRVYVLHLSDDGESVTMSYEWTNIEKRSIQQAVSGLSVDRMPLLGRCMRERAPVFLTRNKTAKGGAAQAQNGAAEDGMWYYTAVPCMRDGRIEDFLCIENSREHPADAALFSALLPRLLRERQRFQGQGTPAEGEADVCAIELPNLRDYMDVIHTFSSERYSSLGVVCLDVPGLSAINSRQGFEYGNRLLAFVCRTIQDIFSGNRLFRTWDAEFVALCPNTTQQVFSGRCARLQMRLQHRYPDTVRIGSTWADGVFAGKRLADEARTIMHSGHTGLPHTEHTGLAGTGLNAQTARFTVFFQPKVDIRTGALVGAEALARGVDEAGGIVPPVRFIEALEREGKIRELDLFILDRTLAQMDRWREKGYRLFPVSVNFSRLTLFDPTVVASVLAIQSRYPALPEDILEIEITENAGNAEKTTLSGIMSRMREFGIRFGLDDFGSEYANLSTFANVRFDTIKLDRSLIAGLSGNEINQMLVRDIVQICKKQGMCCVAEGVETETQLNQLQLAGCTCAQGFYYDRPLPEAQFERKYLHKNEQNKHEESGKEERSEGGIPRERNK